MKPAWPVVATGAEFLRMHATGRVWRQRAWLSLQARALGLRRGRARAARTRARQQQRLGGRLWGRSGRAPGFCGQLAMQSARRKRPLPQQPCAQSRSLVRCLRMRAVRVCAQPHSWVAVGWANPAELPAIIDAARTLRTAKNVTDAIR